MDIKKMDVWRKRKVCREPEIRWWALNGIKMLKFKKKVLDGGFGDMEIDTNSIWKVMRERVRKVAGEVLGILRDKDLALRMHGGGMRRFKML
ncbi:MAG: hypothetical protein DI543_26550 [Bradyrhizobium icense]|nr:MAG: hypothetical protein DI543_26550 [Bradyrhizobium icense]